MRKGLLCGIIGFVGILVFSFFFVHSATAANIAVFGNNKIDEFLVSQGHSVDLVTDYSLQQPGYLDKFDIFLYTRDYSSHGQANVLSPNAAEAVSLFMRGNIPGGNITGNIVLFMTDLVDMIGPSPQKEDPDHYAEMALLNAVNFASSGNGNG